MKRAILPSISALVLAAAVACSPEQSARQTPPSKSNNGFPSVSFSGSILGDIHELYRGPAAGLPQRLKGFIGVWGGDEEGDYDNMRDFILCVYTNPAGIVVSSMYGSQSKNTFAESTDFPYHGKNLAQILLQENPPEQ